MKKNSRLLKWSLRLLALCLVLVAASLFWVEYQLDRFAGAGTPVVDPARFEGSSGPVAITGVQVLAPDGQSMVPGQTVLFDETGILAIGPDPALPADAKRVDGAGRFLVPGLVDAHVHLKQSPNDLLLYVANGVTGVREMSGNAQHLGWRDDIEGGRIGPRLFVASEKLESRDWLAGEFQRWTRYRINVRKPADAAGIVHDLKAQGYDAVKLGSILDADTYAALCRAAQAEGMPLIGHIPIYVTLQDVWRCHQGEVAHIEEIVKALDAEFGYFGNQDADGFLAFVEERSGEVAARLADEHIAVVSSLWLVESIARQKVAPAEVVAGIRIAYANPGLVEGTPLSKGWLPGNNAYELAPGTPAGEREAHRRYWNTFARAHHIVLRALRDAGVRVMAGTDANTAGVVPGFSLHDELGSLVAAGMSPAQALQAATAAPARGMEPPRGRLAPGMRADMVLLRENPLADIANTREIEAVVLDGRYLGRQRLDEMLDAVLAANRSVASGTY